MTHPCIGTEVSEKNVLPKYIYKQVATFIAYIYEFMGISLLLL